MMFVSYFRVDLYIDDKQLLISCSEFHVTIMIERIMLNARHALQQCSTSQGIIAGTHHFVDLWARDSLFATFGSDASSAKTTIGTFLKFQRNDGKTLYTNILYWRALGDLGEKLKQQVIGQKIRDTFWNGRYFSDWTDWKRQDYFASHPNMLAIVFGLTNTTETKKFSNLQNSTAGMGLPWKQTFQPIIPGAFRLLHT